MKTCPFFGVCGGCKYDVAASDYREKKLDLISDLPITGQPWWGVPATRRRADFAFADSAFGFYRNRSKNIVQITECPLLCPEINAVIPQLAAMPWGGAGACLVTLCDNGLDVAVTSSVPYFSSEFKRASENLPVIRVTWNGRVVMQKIQPTVNFAGHVVDYSPNAFLQPTIPSENAIRDMVIKEASGAHRVADLFCGLGNFTFALNADGFDISGIGIKRDLFVHPLTVGMLNQYDCVVMDPPRAGAYAQCRELVKSNIKRVIYVSCNPDSWRRDAGILSRGGFELKHLVPVDQFLGSVHWELFSVFIRNK